MTTVQRIVGWAETEREVRAVLLVGSRGEPGGRPDALSDYDVLVFTRNRRKYETDDAWLSSFGSILVMLREGYELLGTTVPTRLVQYRDGTRIDFSLCDLELLERVAEEVRLPDMLDAGYRVLVDKDGWASGLPESTGAAYRGSVPEESDFQSVVNEFWWEVTCVAKHLARGELFPALYSSECVIRFQSLVPMLEWHAQAVRGTTTRIGPHGRGLMRVLREDERERLEKTVPRLSLEGGWEALFAVTEYFRDVLRSVAEHFGFAAQDELAEGVEAFVRDIRARRSGKSADAG